MLISTQAAAEPLNEIALAQRRACILRGYERGAPHFNLWGFIWMLGYGLTDVVPSMAGRGWLLFDVIGLAGSFLLGRASVAALPLPGAAYGLRFSAVAATMLDLYWLRTMSRGRTARRNLELFRHC